MSKIDYLITTSTVEIVRDRILSILSDELANQKLLAQNADPQTDETAAIAAQIPDRIFSERYHPINTNEYEVISVTFGSNPLNTLQFTESQHSEALFFVIISVKSKSKISSLNPETIERADQLSVYKLHRLIRICRNILMSENYRTLDFNPKDDAYIGRISCSNIRIGHPYSDTSDDSQNYVTGYFEIRALITEETQGVTTIPFESMETTAENENDNYLTIINEFS